MSGTVYVAGELLSKGSGLRERDLTRVYELIRQTLEGNGYTVLMPEADDELTRMGPSSFYREISDRIRAADYVVTVLGRKSYSPPAESAIAAQYGKTQVIVGPPRRVPSKFLAGMPGVAAVGTYAEIQQLLSLVSATRRARGGGGAGGGGAVGR